MHLIANLVSEKFPNTARIFYGLSRNVFVNEPEIVHIAVKQDLLKAAVANGHLNRVREMLLDKLLDSKDLTKPFSLAIQQKNFEMMQVLSDDMRFDPKPHHLGSLGADIAVWCMENPRYPAPTRNDVLRAAFGPHGGVLIGSHIIWNTLSTLQAILSDDRLNLADEFCRELSEVVCGFLFESPWEKEGVSCHLFKKIPNYVYYTNMRMLAKILMEHPRFVAYSDDLRTAWQHE